MGTSEKRKAARNDSIYTLKIMQRTLEYNEKALRAIPHVEWIDSLKVIATLLVIIGHCTYYNIQSSYGGINLLTIIAEPPYPLS